MDILTIIIGLAVLALLSFVFWPIKIIIKLICIPISLILSIIQKLIPSSKSNKQKIIVQQVQTNAPEQKPLSRKKDKERIMRELKKGI